VNKIKTNLAWMTNDDEKRDCPMNDINIKKKEINTKTTIGELF
jgi:hypothetical protein